MFHWSAVSPLNPPHILLLCSGVNLQLSLSLISGIGLSISPLSLPLSSLVVSFLSQVCWNPLASTPPSQQTPYSPFFRRSPPPSLFCPCFFLYSLQNASLKAELFSPCRPIYSQETQWADVLARLILPLSLSQCLSFMLTWKQWSAVVTSLCMCVRMSRWTRLRNWSVFQKIHLWKRSVLNCIECAFVMYFNS